MILIMVLMLILITIKKRGNEFVPMTERRGKSFDRIILIDSKLYMVSKHKFNRWRLINETK